MAAEARRERPAMGSFEDYMPDDVAGFEDLFSDEERPGQKDKSTKPSEATAGLGIDEEVSVQKRVRVPRVKLDESRLLSAKGIPALRQRARHLKLKGKGHEFSDAARLLSMYQLWLDDLFPKAQFADALTMVEKEGHKASMHKMRMEWINESKPKDRDAEAEQHENGRDENGRDGEAPSRPDQQPASGTDAGNDVPEDVEDLYSASTVRPVARPHVADEVPDEDELDALMAEAMEVHGDPAPAPAPAPAPGPPAPSRADDFDDLDALMAEAEAA